jgi:5-methylcytosine-specific restriction endonuclease McrA
MTILNYRAPKKGRLRLEPQSYKNLCRQVLERDSWRCQKCGSTEYLQVHHICWRSSLGADAAENLITLCSDCHRRVHSHNS